MKPNEIQVGKRYEQIFALILLSAMILAVLSGCASTYEELKKEEQDRYQFQASAWEKYCPEGRVCK